MVRVRTSKSHPEDGNVPIQKTIKTSITRYNPAGVICTATTATRNITASTNNNDEIEQPSEETTQCTREDGSVVITTRTTNVLPDGYISIVVAEAVIWKVSIVKRRAWLV